jgi:hypothetical protein
VFCGNNQICLFVFLFFFELKQKGLMNRMGPNFRKDQSGMSTQLRRLQSLVRHLDEPLFEYLKSVACDNLYFTFRWMLLHFKRELDYDGVKMVWEAIWSSPDPDHFHLFIVFAVLQQVTKKESIFVLF